ncbi:hypothetical protein F0P96_12200 [Hymenobacter busanensis]|uniref:Uncharacterized protein n=1 Tax=Hymenobacter busanensis TaxID=2607656 RepID=A0A7L4ZX60_9BACT|nr:hypothetical protein [Hymenobacter busanensis]KAA9332237.1 hypothetical protein F0P96_12200 [Hymenobacter busanensis]QHJ07425.1 hypothetical protein GUY19_09070 [Hymenobacter busanensis]
MIRLSPLLRQLPWLCLLLMAACTAPRSVIHSGKVTPRGQFKAGGNLGFNVGTSSIGKITGAVKSLAEQAITQDTVNYRPALDKVQEAALAYVLDPTVATSDLYVRYGVVDRLDVGYKYSFGAHSFDAMYQFMGPTGTPEKPGGPANANYGSVGLQFSTQRAKLPNIPFLDDAQTLLGFTAKRIDLLVPVVFSHSFGNEEEIGNVSYGLAYSRSFVKYGFEPGKIFSYVPGSTTVTEKIPSLLAKKSYGALGGFVNLKLGYRYAYFLPALAIYYQNYGTYKLLNNKEAKLKGVTIIPSLGVQFRIPAGKNR